MESALVFGPDMSETKSESFAAMFEESSANAPRQKRIDIGAMLKGRVVQVGKETIFVELDGKRQAFVDAVEYKGPDGVVRVKVGDMLEAPVIGFDDNGDVRLGRSLGKSGNLATIEQARDARVAIEGKVSGVNKGGLEIDLDGTRAFCPISQADSRFVQDPTTMVGKTYRFHVMEIRENGKSIVLSRKSVLADEARVQSARALESITQGAVLRGTVTSIRDFGAFVDIGGIEGLIPNSELSHDRSVQAGQVVSAGDLVEVQVREIKEVVPNKPGGPTIKITLSLKSLTADPWEAISMLAPEGKVVSGTVTRLAEFGAFVRIAAGIEGLLHISELGAKVDHPSKVLKVGQQLMVVVKKVDTTTKKISLVPAPDGLAVGSAVHAVSVAVGSIVSGTVEKIEPFGVFLQLDGTKGRQGRGLIPNAELGTPRGSDTRKHFPEGTKLSAKVLETGDGRLRLSIKAIKEDEERADFTGYRESVVADGSLGTFGDVLRKKLGQ